MDSNGSNWVVKYTVLSQSVSVNIFFKSKFQTVGLNEFMKSFISK